MTENNEITDVSGRELAQQKHLTTLAETIRQEVAKIEEYARRTVKHALLAGKLLCEAKNKVGHGNWLDWFEKQTFSFAEVTAQRYMRLYRGWPELQERLVELGDRSSLTDLSLHSALQLLSNPDKLKSSASKVVKPIGFLDRADNESRNCQELASQIQASYVEELPTPSCLLKAAKAVLSCMDISPDTKRTGYSANQMQHVPASPGKDRRWSGKVFLNPARNPESLQLVSRDLYFAYASGDVVEAILLVPTQVEASWYRRFREFARVHLIKPDDETGSDWMESLTAIYLGDRQELFFEAFKAIGDGYLPYGAFVKPR